MEQWIQRSLTIVTLALLIVSTACATVTGSGSRPATVTHGGATVTATVARSAHHGGGFTLNTQAPPVPTTILSGSLPASVDLNRFNPPVADQGSEAECTAFATGYYLRGWYANRDGYYPPSGFAASFTYDQVTKSSNGGTSFRDNLAIEQSEGLDTQGDYFRPIRPNGTTYPVADSVLTNAVRYKISSYTDYLKGNSQVFVNYIKQELASQNPLAIGIYTSPGFDGLSGSNSSDMVNDTSQKTGLHALFAYGYDQNGLLVENEWGTDWGYNGYAELSWKYVEAFGVEVVSISPLPPTAPVWQKLPGTATAISVGADGSVWALGTTPVPGGYGIYHWDASTWTWNEIPGGGVRIAVDPNGNPWVINNANNIFSWDGSSWHEMPGFARDIAVGKYGVVWIVTAASSQVHCPPTGCTNKAANVENVPGVPGVRCQASFCDGSVYFWTGTTWQQVRGTANRIAINSLNDPWAVNSSGAVSYYIQPQGSILGLPTATPTPSGWMPVPFPGSAKALAIPDLDESEQEVWAVSTDGNLFKRNSTSSQWTIISDPGVAVAVAASPLGGAWVVNSNGDMYELPSWKDA